MNFILKHRVFIFWIVQILIFGIVYRYQPSWFATLIAAILAGIIRTNPWSWWKTPLAHILGLIAGATHDHLWNVADVLSSILGLTHPAIYVGMVLFITTLLVTVTAQAVWLWMPHRKIS